MSSSGFFRTLRIFFLLMILVGVAIGTWATKSRTTSWKDPLWVVVYPVNGDGSRTSSQYIAVLDKEIFRSVERFIEWEARRYSLPLKRPLVIRLGPTVHDLPPAPPEDRTVWKIMVWSLKLRYWAYRVDTYRGPPRDIRIFVQYFDPSVHKQLSESLGLQKGMICVAKAFASQRMEKENNIVIAHELLHTVGATDKYDLSNNQPVYPEGYAEPGKIPLFPQEKAEIMAGRIPLSKSRADMPVDLARVVIGEKTAREIRWIE